ncbi:MAG: hypothetical protein KDD85_12780 [Parvularculaceae bacterium]|nr:hypothetical protein [Parvularculaceae bacterium]
MTEHIHPEQTSPKIARRRAVRFFQLACGALVGAISLVALAARFDFLGAGFHVNFALLLGVAGTILLGVGLMALSFYSNRSGADDAVLNKDDGAWREGE